MSNKPNGSDQDETETDTGELQGNCGSNLMSIYQLKPEVRKTPRLTLAQRQVLENQGIKIKTGEVN